ncbi:MAG: PilW family protein [Nitrospirota bacterium]
MKKINDKGFTLIEILVSLAILGIVLAGIYSVYTMQHKSYIVQEQVANMQQNERVALQMITRDIRMAGLGLQFCNNAAGGKVIFSDGVNNYNGFGNDDSDRIAVEYHSFSPTAGGETELTADILLTAASTNLDVKGTADFADGDWVMVIDGGGDCHYALFCVTNVLPAALRHINANGGSCANKATYGNNLATGFRIGDRVRRLNREDGGNIIYAINDNYQLTRSVDSAAAQPLADNIEDMQIAYGIDINGDGVVAPDDGDGIVEIGEEWFNDPAGRDMTLLREIRVTLVARTTREDPAYNAGIRPQIEDHAPATNTTTEVKYRRRVLQSTIKLRNIDATVAMF